MIICLVYIGKVPSYVRECVQQIKEWSDLKLYFITNDIESCKELLYDYEVNYINPDELQGENIIQLEEKRKYFSLCNWVKDREHLFYYSMLRLYLIENFMRKYEVSGVFHLEIDNLIYYNPIEFKSIFDTKGISYLYEDKNRGCASVFYARDLEAIKQMNDKIITYIKVDGGFNTEMEFLGKYAEEEADNVFVLPHAIPDKNINSMVYSNFETFNKEWLFDSMSIGMWLTGIDKIHSNGTLKKCKSPWASLDLTKYTYLWNEDETGRKYPAVSYNNTSIRIFNLHVHSKDLKPYLSTKYKLPSNRTLISGENFQEVCEMFIDVADDDKTWVPHLTDDKRHIHIKEIMSSSEIDNPKLVYIRGWNLDKLYILLEKFKNPFILIAHNADEWIKNNQLIIPLLSSEKIIFVYSQNICVSHPKLRFLPIGLANRRWPHGNMEIFKKYMNRRSNKIGSGIYFNFSIETAPWYRQSCYDILSKKGLKWVENKPYEEYLQEIINYKYAICPMGNGFDTHRLWECVYLGIIPIVIYHPFINNILQTAKIAILKSWDDLPVENGVLDEDKLNIYLNNKDEIYVEDYTERPGVFR
jgi:hypothetical protein